MLLKDKGSAFSFIYSLAVHLAALLIITLTFELRGTQATPLFNDSQEIIQGVLIDEGLLNQERQRIADRVEQAREAEEALRIESQRIESERVERARQQEEMRVEASRIAQEQESLRVDQVRNEERRRQEQAQRQREAEVERQRLAEQARLRARDVERTRLAEVARNNTESRAAERRAELENQRRLREIDQERNFYIRLIEARITQAWIRPGTVSDVRCRLLVTQIPSGDVVDVEVLECNASDAVIRSIEAAVNRASPLPQPRVSGVFDRLLELDFIIEQ